MLVAAAALVVLIVALYLLFFSGSKSGTIPSTNPITPSSSNAAKQSSGSSSQTSSPSSSTSDTKTQSNTPASTFSGTLLTPYGDFVSNHHPGGSAPTSEASVCNTSAGATCYIQFTKGGVVKKLAAQTTDANGATYWYWDVKTAGLDSGTWTITAVAAGGGQTKTANDPQSLVVQ
jgi:hypothetical protein